MGQPRLRHALLEGERILLRPISARDAERAFGVLHGRREILDWLAWSGPHSLAEVAEHYARWRRASESGDDYQFAVVERASAVFSGSIAVRFAGHPFNANLGYWIDPERWGRGYASEAIRLATWLAFARLESVLAYAHLDVENHGSRRALEKSGFAEDCITTKEFPSGARRVRNLSLSRTGFARAFGGWSPPCAEVELEPREPPSAPAVGLVRLPPASSAPPEPTPEA